MRRPLHLLPLLLAASACRADPPPGNPSPVAPSAVGAASSRQPPARSAVLPPAPPAPSASAIPAPSSAPDTDFVGTIGIDAVSRDGAFPAKLVDVRSARHGTFDRVVFEFDGEVPGHHVEYVDRPVRKCGSGDTTPIAGDGWLEVRMTPADAHDQQGRPLVARREQKLELGVLRELELTCDFEAEVVWVLGVASPNRYRVLRLSAPPRLVVDVRHGH